MKNLLIKLGLWEEKEKLTLANMEKLYQAAVQAGDQDNFVIEALRHYCGKCDRWFEKYVGKLSHQRAAHEGVFKKDRSKDA